MLTYLFNEAEEETVKEVRQGTMLVSETMLIMPLLAEKTRALKHLSHLSPISRNQVLLTLVGILKRTPSQKERGLTVFGIEKNASGSQI